MISIRQTASIFCRSPFSSQATHYTTRSNGAAFLSSLDFLTPAPSQPNAFQQSKKSFLDRPQPNQSSNREFIRSRGSAHDALDGLGLSFSNASGTKAPLKKTVGYSGFGSNLSNMSSQNATANYRPNANNDRRPLSDKHRRDEEIEAEWIQYITPEGNQGEKQLSRVLKSFDRSQYYLVEVDSRAQPPICKLFSKKELYMKAKAAKQAKKSNGTVTKELQLNWGTDSHDLSHKLPKFRAFLEKGCRLEIQVNGRKGKSSTQQERDMLMERIKAEFEPVSKYVRQPEWVKSTTVTMLLQGTPEAEKGDKAKK
ncbi:hypothetical protein BG011_006753 [Mortierella polycephala]|uniref:Translation initiation factor 3 N-terminal domain-containing protein n=1 Tax=Mortierella polycephala TaxID=41804 RepID=A0A9P6QHJ9_9FUNG|nr:hypothetical protein BG011_006753 [Mortierella polycephala]